MTDLLVTKNYQCPYCGETIDTCVDTSAGSQQCIEDCSVCCRPIELTITVDGIEGDIQLTARSDTE